jgi:Bacteriophage lambda head decoration protein D
MPTFVEKLHPGNFLMSEAHGRLSRDYILMAEGQVLDVGTVLGSVEDDFARTFSALDLSAHDGREVAQAILYAPIDTTGAPAIAVAITRNAEVIAGMLIWPEGITDMQRAMAIAQLEKRPPSLTLPGIIVR